MTLFADFFEHILHICHLKDMSYWSLVEMHCPILQKPAGVTVLPPRCGLEPAISGTVCRLSCPQGFILSGAREELRCLSFGRWSANIKDALCKGRDQHKIVSVYACAALKGSTQQVTV